MLSRLCFITFLALGSGGCLHVTMDVNAKVDVNVKVDRALNDFFGDIDKRSSTINSPTP